MILNTEKSQQQQFKLQRRRIQRKKGKKREILTYSDEIVEENGGSSKKELENGNEELNARNPRTEINIKLKITDPKTNITSDIK